MDIFSLGCVIAEILLDGTALFTYEQLVAYRRNEYDDLPKMIQKIKDPKLESLIQDMTKKDPNERPSIYEVLRRFAKDIAPESFAKCVYQINSCLVSHNFITSDHRIALIRELLEPIYLVIIKE